MTQKRGARHSTATAFLKPAAGRPNLTVETEAFTTRILFDGTTSRRRRIPPRRPDARRPMPRPRSSLRPVPSTRLNSSCSQGSDRQMNCAATASRWCANSPLRRRQPAGPPGDPADLGVQAEGQHAPCRETEATAEVPGASSRECSHRTSQRREGSFTPGRASLRPTSSSTSVLRTTRITDSRPTTTTPSRLVRCWCRPESTGNDPAAIRQPGRQAGDHRQLPRRPSRHGCDG